jgi:hypothetical protein
LGLQAHELRIQLCKCSSCAPNTPRAAPTLALTFDGPRGFDCAPPITLLGATHSLVEPARGPASKLSDVLEAANGQNLAAQFEVVARQDAWLPTATRAVSFLDVCCVVLPLLGSSVGAIVVNAPGAATTATVDIFGHCERSSGVARLRTVRGRTTPWENNDFAVVRASRTERRGRSG